MPTYIIPMHLSEGNDKLTVYEMFSRSFFLLVFKKINKTGFMRLVAVLPHGYKCG